MKRPFMMCFRKSSVNTPKNVILTCHSISTGSNHLYNDGSLASVNIPSSAGEERLDHVPISRRADPGEFDPNRAVIPQCGQLSVCSAHFKPAESLPPPPSP